MGSTGDENKACCTGHVWDGTPTGKDISIGGVDAYLAEPSTSSDKAVLLIPDIMGYKAKNTRLLADKFAKDGFLAIVPDQFNGDAWTADRDFSKFGEWAGNFPRESQQSIVEEVLAEAKSKYNVKHVGAIGFCWGGLYTVLLAGSGQVEAGVIAHGSKITLDDVKGIKQPVMFLFADNDQQIPEPFRKQIEEMLPQLGPQHKTKFYPGAAHGFAVRGDIKDKKVLEDADDAFAQALQFFKTHVGASQ